MVETLVDNEVAVAELAEEWRNAHAVYSWSLSRRAGSSMFSVKAEGPTPSIIANDLRFEILTDPVNLEVTRGVSLTIHHYQTMDTSDSVVDAALRRQVTEALHHAVIENCFRLPE